MTLLCWCGTVPVCTKEHLFSPADVPWRSPAQKQMVARRAGAWLSTCTMQWRPQQSAFLFHCRSNWIELFAKLINTNLVIGFSSFHYWLQSSFINFLFPKPFSSLAVAEEIASLFMAKVSSSTGNKQESDRWEWGGQDTTEYICLFFLVLQVTYWLHCCILVFYERSGFNTSDAIDKLIISLFFKSSKFYVFMIMFFMVVQPAHSLLLTCSRPFLWASSWN